MRGWFTRRSVALFSLPLFAGFGKIGVKLPQFVYNKIAWLKDLNEGGVHGWLTRRSQRLISRSLQKILASF